MYWNTTPYNIQDINFWLIETWDVLKSDNERNRFSSKQWLIETWDVLKYL